MVGVARNDESGAFNDVEPLGWGWDPDFCCRKLRVFVGMFGAVSFRDAEDCEVELGTFFFGESFFVREPGEFCFEVMAKAGEFVEIVEVVGIFFTWRYGAIGVEREDVAELKYSGWIDA